MAFRVKPFVEVVALTKEKLDEALAPIRARAARARAEVSMAKLDETLIALERSIHESCTDKEIDFDCIIGKIDKYELTERKRKQIVKLIQDLFPERKP